MRLAGQADLEFARACAQAVAEALRAWGVIEERVVTLEVAVAEMATNVARHGYAGARGPLELDVVWDAEGLAITLRDEGLAFDPADGPPPPDPDPDDPSTWPEGGMGLAIVRAAGDELRYRREAGRNVLTLYTADPLAAAPAS